MLYRHTICPILSILSSIFFEEYEYKGLKDIAIATIILNVLRLIKGPYPFLFVYDQPIYASIIWLILIIIIVNTLAYVLIKLNRRFYGRSKSIN